MIFVVILVVLFLVFGGLAVLGALIGLILGKIVFLVIVGGLFVLGAMLLSGDPAMMITAGVIIALILAAWVASGRGEKAE